MYIILGYVIWIRIYLNYIFADAFLFKFYVPF